MIMTDDKRTHPMRIAVDFIAPWKVECPICGKVVDRDELEEHIRREHEVWVARYVRGKRED